MRHLFNLIVLLLLLSGCKTTKESFISTSNKSLVYTYEREVPGINIRTVFLPDTFNVVDSIFIQDTSGRGSAIVWRNKYNQLVVDCQTKGESVRESVSEDIVKEEKKESKVKEITGLDSVTIVLLIFALFAMLAIIKKYL